MRATLSLKGDAFATAQACWRAFFLKRIQAVSEFFCLGSAERFPMQHPDGTWIFELPTDKLKVSAARLKDVLDEVS